MEELVLYLVQSLVSKPESVKIKSSNGEGSANFEFSVDPADMGMVIGKSGQTIRAIRKLLISRALAENRNLRVNLTLVES